jgi:hypothetical protein
LREPAHGLRERWRNGAGRLPDLKISAPSVVPRMLVWADATDFSTIAKRGRRCLREPAHGLREQPRAMAQWRGQVAGPQEFGPVGRCTHVGVGTRRDRFSTIDKRGRRCLREPAHGLREQPRAMARRAGVYRPQEFGPVGRCTHIGVGARRDRFSTIDKRGRRCLREPAHGLGEWPRAMARRGRHLPDLGISAPSLVARILAWARDATDF